MSVWKFTPFKMAGSSSWHCSSGPMTRTSGSRGKTTVPSGTISTSTVSSMFFSQSKNSGSNRKDGNGKGLCESTRAGMCRLQLQ